MGLFRRVDHVGVAVHDLDAALAWYTQTFDMRVVAVDTNEEQGVREALLAVGEGATYLQLLAPLTPQSPIAKFLHDRGEGIQQIAYTVDDVDAVSATLRNRGVELLYDAPRPGSGGTRVNFVHPKSAGGVLIELVEPPGAQP